MTPAQQYRDMSARYLRQAHAELTAGDYPQASEKFWGAATQQVKAVAQQRGLRHRGHYLLVDAVKQLADKSRDPELNRLFKTAQDLHVNFYEHNLDPRIVHGMAEDVRELISRLQAIDDPHSP